MKINAFGFIVGLLLLGAAIAVGLWNFRTPVRVFEVKGISERVIPANLGIYKLSFYAEGKTFQDAKQKSYESKQKVLSWLAKNNITPESFSMSSMVKTKHSDNKADVIIVTTAVLVSSEEVQKIRVLEENANTLIAQDVMLGDGSEYSYNSNTFVQYELRNLDDVRPAMLEEAAKSAERLAKKFAQDLNVRLGSVQDADPGSFEVVDDAAGPWNKKVRVVSRVRYSLG